MPTYEYVCAKCDHAFEVFQSIAEDPLTVCPRDRCAQKRWAKGRVKRAISGGAGLLFKGSGFYITDYRSEGYKAAAQKENPPPTSGATSGDGKAATPKTETKAAPAKSTSS
jgi:putative FmdB family regulatory protein